MRYKPDAESSQYGYATGLIRSLEAHMMDANRLNRLFEARSADDITRVMQESGYTADDAEAGLKRETIAVYSLIAELMR